MPSWGINSIEPAALGMYRHDTWICTGVDHGDICVFINPHYHYAVLIVEHMQIPADDDYEKIQQKIYVRFAFEFAEKIPRMDIKGTDQYYLPEKINRFFDTLNVQKGISKPR